MAARRPRREHGTRRGGEPCTSVACVSASTATDCGFGPVGGGFFVSELQLTERESASWPSVIRSAKVSFVAACTLGKLAHAEGAAATARAFCQAMAELEHWEAQEAAAQARLRRRAAAAQPSRDTHGGANADAEPGSSRREGSAPATSDPGAAAGRAAASIFGAVSGTVSSLLSAGSRDTVFSGMFPQSTRRGAVDGAGVLKPALHRGPRGEVVYEWLAPSAPVSPLASPHAAARRVAALLVSGVVASACELCASRSPASRC